MHAVAEKERLSEETASAYVRLLEDVHLVRLLPAWGTTLGSRIRKRPKVHVVDTGLASRLLRVSADKLAGRDPSSQAEFGHLLETFVVGEVLRQLSWWTGATSLCGHWNHYEAGDVDLVVERDDGRIAGIEVKAASTVAGRTRAACSHSATPSVIASSGVYCSISESPPIATATRYWVMPVDRLWSVSARGVARRRSTVPGTSP